MNNLKPVVKRFIDNIMLDLAPQTVTERADFGLDLADDPTALFAAYQKGIRSGTILYDELNIAVGEGNELTKLVQRVDPNIAVKTVYDLCF